MVEVLRKGMGDRWLPEGLRRAGQDYDGVQFF
jgi:hypothetical protein